MGQLNCRAPKFDRRIKSKSDPQSEETTACVFDYNTILLEELRLLKISNTVPDELNCLTEKRLEMEARSTREIDNNRFTSYSPGTYSFELRSNDPRDSRASFVATLPQLFHSKTRLMNFSLEVEFGDDMKCVIVESANENMLRVLRLTCEIFSDIGKICDSSSQLGRLILYDFRDDGSCNAQINNVCTFLCRILIHHLLNTFKYTILDGVPFIDLPLIDIRPGVSSRFRSLDKWIETCLRKTFREMLEEFQRLMTMAFKIRRTCLPVFVFAGINDGPKSNINDLLRIVAEIAEGSDGKAVTVFGGDNLDGFASILMQGYKHQVTCIEFSQSKSSDESHDIFMTS